MTRTNSLKKLILTIGVASLPFIGNAQQNVEPTEVTHQTKELYLASQMQKNKEPYMLPVINTPQGDYFITSYKTTLPPEETLVMHFNSITGEQCIYVDRNADGKLDSSDDPRGQERYESHITYVTPYVFK